MTRVEDLLTLVWGGCPVADLTPKAIRGLLDPPDWCDADGWPLTDATGCCTTCSQWTPREHREAHDHLPGCAAVEAAAAWRAGRSCVDDHLHALLAALEARDVALEDARREAALASGFRARADRAERERDAARAEGYLLHLAMIRHRGERDERPGTKAEQARGWRCPCGAAWWEPAEFGCGAPARHGAQR